MTGAPPELALAASVLRLIGDLTLLGAVVIALWGGAREWYYWWWQVKRIEDTWRERYNELRADRDEWRQTARHGISTTSTALHVAEKQSERSP